MPVRKILLWLARTSLAGWLIRMGFAYMSFAIPVQRLRETTHLLAFYHPSPSYPVHILLVPKKTYRSLLDVPVEDTGFQRDLLETVQSLIRQLGLEQGGYRLITNGGSYQEVGMLHYHLISDVERKGTP